MEEVIAEMKTLSVTALLAFVSLATGQKKFDQVSVHVSEQHCLFSVTDP